MAAFGIHSLPIPANTATFTLGIYSHLHLSAVEGVGDSPPHTGGGEPPIPIFCRDENCYRLIKTEFWGRGLRLFGYSR